MAKNPEIKINQGALDAVAKEAGRNYALLLQKRLDNLLRLHKGKPLDEVKRHLQADFRSNGGSITDPELSAWAQMIHDGSGIVVRK